MWEQKNKDHVPATQQIGVGEQPVFAAVGPLACDHAASVADAAASEQQFSPANMGRRQSVENAQATSCWIRRLKLLSVTVIGVESQIYYPTFITENIIQPMLIG